MTCYVILKIYDTRQVFILSLCRNNNILLLSIQKLKVLVVPAPYSIILYIYIFNFRAKFFARGIFMNELEPEKFNIDDLIIYRGHKQ